MDTENDKSQATSQLDLSTLGKKILGMVRLIE